MKSNIKYYLAAVLIIAAIAVAVVNVPKLSLPLSLEDVQTDQSIQYAATGAPENLRYVERVPAMTGESKDLTEHLKLVNLRYVERVPAMTGESKELTESLKVLAAQF